MRCEICSFHVADSGPFSHFGAVDVDVDADVDAAAVAVVHSVAAADLVVAADTKIPTMSYHIVSVKTDTKDLL